jgi:leucyl-tRNA synthetase
MSQAGLIRSAASDLIRLMAPFAPHFCEEMWERLGGSKSVFLSGWPELDEAALIRDTIEIAVQINGQVKFRLDIPSDADQEKVKALVESSEHYDNLMIGRKLVKFIYVKGRLANLVVKQAE